MSNKNENTNTNPETNPATESTETKLPEKEKISVFQKIGRWVDSPFRQIIHPAKFEQDEAMKHLQRAEEIIAVNPKDRPSVRSIASGCFRILGRGLAIGAAVFGVTSVLNNKNNEDNTLNIEETNNDDVIE